MYHLLRKIKHPVYFAPIITLILAIIVADHYKLFIPRQQRREIHQKFIIPPEFMDGDTLYLGDSYEKISRLITMEQFWYYDGLSQNKQYTEGYYWGNRGIDHLQFNYQNKLISLDFDVTNRDSISMKQHFIKTAKTLIKYYGNNYEVYHHRKFKSCRLLLWRLPENNTIFFNGNIDRKNMSVKDSNSIFIDYNNPFNHNSLQLSTKEERKDLGLE